MLVRLDRVFRLANTAIVITEVSLFIASTRTAFLGILAFQGTARGASVETV